MAHRTHREEHIRKKTIKSAIHAEAQLPHFEAHEEEIITGEMLPFILTHFFPKDKQATIRKFLHTLRSDKKKRAKKHAKRADSLEEAGCYRDEHAFHNTHTKVRENHDASGMARSKKENTHMTTHKNSGNKKR